MRIGEVHALLRQDYPDIELSKIRYYEDKGLVKPLRSKKGYRLYGDRDVACLREAIRLANEEYVPLRVVRLRLIEAGLLDDDGSTSSHAPRAAARTATPNNVSLNVPQKEKVPVVAVEPMPAVMSFNLSAAFSIDAFAAESTLSFDQINALVAIGLLTPVQSDNALTFSGADLDVARRAAPLLSRGIDARLLGSLRRTAEREIGLIEDILVSLRNSQRDRQDLGDGVLTYDVANDVAQLRGALSARAIRDFLGN